MKKFYPRARLLLFVVLVIVLMPFPLAFAQNFAATIQAPLTNNEVSQTDPRFNVPEEYLLTNEPSDQDLLKEPLADPKSVPMPVAIPSTSEQGIGDSSRYTLGTNDVIEVTVLRHPEFSNQFVINNEGKIQYDYLGDIKIAGMTKDELKTLLTQRLSEFIITPEVTVKIVAYNSKVVYVIGEVGTPGKIFMRGDTMTVREALVQAGLPLLSASTRKCRLITPAEGGKAEIKYVNVFSLLYEGDLRENLVMKPGDTLYIPATVMSKAMRVISPVAQPISTAVGTGQTVTTGIP